MLRHPLNIPVGTGLPLLTAMPLLLLLAGCQSSKSQDEQVPKPEYLRQYEKGFPPVEQPIEFEGQHASYPPPIKGLPADATARLQFQADPQPPMRQLAPTLRDAALRDPKVKSALGDRFAMIGGGPVEPDKQRPVDLAKRPIALDFYSYSNNRALVVVMEGNKVVSINAQPRGYQPPESHEEVEAAAQILRKDPGHAKAITGLTVRGIQTPSEDGNRHLQLLFYKPNSRAAAFGATIDMTSGRVVSARPTGN
jgi:hypothetical protein